jgi:hypothetical protein
MRANYTEMERLARAVTFGFVTLTACGGAAFGANESDGKVSFPTNASATPAVEYAALDATTCEAKLTERSIAWQPVDTARGVLAPIRLTGTLHGVAFHSALPQASRATSPYEIMDCRLALALDDFAAILEKYEVAEVVHLSAYRPPPKNWPAAKPGERHGGALALDAAIFLRKDGTRLDVSKDFHGAIGAKTCGPKSGPWPATDNAKTLRAIACEAADAHLFNVELTPDFNRKHKNHFHLEVTPGVKWFLVK